MAEIRFNYGDKFTQTTDTNTGIGSTIPAVKLDVAGGASAGSLRVSGIATLSSYQGFVNTKMTTPTEGMIVEAGQSGSLSGEVVVSTGQTISVSTGATTGQGGIQSLKVYETFMPPVGGTADRPTDVKPGMVYYNKDFKTIEFWDGNFWKQVDNTTRSGKAIIHLASTGTTNTTLDFLNISTFGNSQYFGDLTAARFLTGRSSSETRGLFGGGDSSDVIDYVTMASGGNAQDFGNLTTSGRCPGGASSSTRAIFAGVNNSNVISYVEINTLGDALDFGDLTNVAGNRTASFSSPTRFVCMSGHSSPNQGVIDFLNIASKGNTIKFGNLTYAGDGYGSAKMNRGLSNSIRGLFAGGYQPNSPYPVVSFIDYVTIASEGNATNFGDMTSVRYNNMTTGSQTRGILAGGQGDQPSFTREKTIDSVEYATTGNAVNFGELSIAAGSGSANSDSHGGLGGF